MALTIIALVILVIGIFIWAPWSKGTYFEEKVSVEYSKWEGAMGGFGRAVYIYIKAAGTYQVKIVYRKDNATDNSEDVTFEDQYSVNQEAIDNGEGTVLKVIDIDDWEVTFVTVDINDGNSTESHYLRIGGIGS